MSTTGKWLLRATLVALALLIPTDTGRPRKPAPKTPKKPAE
jgi:hypothetical protein